MLELGFFQSFHLHCICSVTTYFDVGLVHFRHWDHIHADLGTSIRVGIHKRLNSCNNVMVWALIVVKQMGLLRELELQWQVRWPHQGWCPVLPVQRLSPDSMGKISTFHPYLHHNPTLLPTPLWTWTWSLPVTADGNTHGDDDFGCGSDRSRSQGWGVTGMTWKYTFRPNVESKKIRPNVELYISS